MTLHGIDLVVAYESPEHVVDSLAQIEERFVAAGDKRGIFVSAYLPITLEIHRRLSAGAFEDRHWVTRYQLAFANRYRLALLAHERGDRDAVPLPWAIAFDAAERGPALLLQHLLLGINAHINHDLPLALSEVSIDPRESRLRDHTAVNAALEAATEPVQYRLAKLYAPALAAVDAICGVLDERLTNFSFVKARESAWTAAVNLVSCTDDEARTRCRRTMEEASGGMAHLLLTPNPCIGPAIQALEALERLSLRLGGLVG